MTRCVVAAFQAAHRERYGYALAEPVELVSIRIRAIGRAEPVPPLGSLIAKGGGPAASGPARRPVRFRGRTIDAALRRRASLAAGERFSEWLRGDKS